jgi:hypothetical protein
MDDLISTGEGGDKELDTKVSIYKKTDENYLLKLKVLKAFYVDEKYLISISVSAIQFIYSRGGQNLLLE